MACRRVNLSKDLTNNNHKLGRYSSESSLINKKNNNNNGLIEKFGGVESDRPIPMHGAVCSVMDNDTNK